MDDTPRLTFRSSVIAEAPNLRENIISEKRTCFEIFMMATDYRFTYGNIWVQRLEYA